MKNAVRFIVASAGLALSFTAMGQAAPTSAQIWDIRFDVDTSGPFAPSDHATAVGITMRARIGIVPGTYNTRNFGISKVGGTTTMTGPGATQFLMTFVDPRGNTPNQGSITRGTTGEAFNDSNGAPMAGQFAAYRGSLSPPSTGGPNTDLSNGQFSTNAAGSPIAGNIIPSRASGFGSPGNIAPDANGYNGDANGTPAASRPGALGAATFDGSGIFTAAHLVGAYSDIFRFIYLPKPDFTDSYDRMIAVTVKNIQAKYLHTNNGSGFFTASADFNTANGGNGGPFQTFSFQVPTPGASALVGLAGLAAVRRRRAA